MIPPKGLRFAAVLGKRIGLCIPGRGTGMGRFTSWRRLIRGWAGLAAEIAHQLHEPVEKIFVVSGPGRGFGMVLDGEQGQIPVG